MWENQTAKQNEQLMPPGAELKAAVTPPLTPKEKQAPNYLLRVQLALCAVLVALALAAKHLDLAFYEPCRDAYGQAMGEGVTLSGQEELIKFASKALDGVRKTAQQVMAGAEAAFGQEQAAPELTGAGGLQPALWPKAPEGCSTKSYLPDFELAQPVTGYNLTSEYGWRRHPLTKKSDFHTGADLAVAQGTPIHPAAEGIVLKTGLDPSYGNNVLVLHTDGVATRYCHMQYVFVRQGEPVQLDTVLGTVGQTGVATGPHLHFELLHDDIRYDPAKALGLE